MLPQNVHSKDKLILISKSAHTTEQAFCLSGGALVRHVCLCCFCLGHTEPVITVYTDDVCVVSVR